MLKNPNLKLILKNLTNESGVYRMLNAAGQVLYVGKAKNLKKRVNSYFKDNNVDIKTKALVEQIHSVEVAVTRSETEAILLESSLIKSLRPKYNVILRDDKSYPYLHVSSNHPYPRMEVLRFKTKPKSGLLFGPYPSAQKVREALNIIQKVFKIRNCTDSYFAARLRPCLQYQINRCSAPCTKFISEKDYQNSLKDALNFLKGKSHIILKNLTKKMDEAAKNLDYEEAGRIRDQMQSLRLVQEQQAVITRQGDADVIVLQVRKGFACVQWVMVRNGQVLSNQQIYPSVPQTGLMLENVVEHLWQEVFLAFLSHFYFDTPSRIPPLILTDHNVFEHEVLEETLSRLRGKKCKIQINPKGIKARWIDFAQNNLKIALEKYTVSSARISNQYEALRQFLQLPNPVKRMECFDISHTQGNETVASCVVFNENGPSKQEYRRFNITGIMASDDYAAMEQVLTRRFQYIAKNLHLVPDLVIVDGGKGQVAAAKRVLLNLNLPNICLLGIAKGVSRKPGWEKLILADENREIKLPSDSSALHLLQNIRDEAHRFAITFHRKKRDKKTLEFSIDIIEGIGIKRRQALLKYFGGLKELTKASMEEIAKVEGISKSLAEKIHAHFH